MSTIMRGTKEHQISLPKSIYNQQGHVRLEKGRFQFAEKKLTLLAWDFSVNCKKEGCTFFDRCKYQIDATVITKKEKCLMQKKYMKNIIAAFLEKMVMKKDNTEEDIVKFGFELIPLYAHLFKFKMYEFGNEDILVYSPRGDQKINPVFKEIRETIKAINGVWRDITGKHLPGKNPSQIGDDSFIDAMYTVSEEDYEGGGEVSEKGIVLDLEDNEDEGGGGGDEGENEDRDFTDELEKKNTVPIGKKVWDKQISAIDRKKRKKKKKKKKPAKVVVKVPSPLSKEKRKEREEKKKEKERIEREGSGDKKKRKRVRKEKESTDE